MRVPFGGFSTLIPRATTITGKWPWTKARPPASIAAGASSARKPVRSRSASVTHSLQCNLLGTHRRCGKRQVRVEPSAVLIVRSLSRAFGFINTVRCPRQTLTPTGTMQASPAGASRVKITSPASGCPRLASSRRRMQREMCSTCHLSATNRCERLLCGPRGKGFDQPVAPFYVRNQ